MATYRELHGKALKTVTTNPTDDAAEGQIWFNSTDNTFKSVVASETTHSGTPMINKRSLYGFGVGTKDAGLVVGGIDDSTYLSVVEEWNGSGWAAGGAYPTARYSAGTAGTQTAAIAYCGRISPSPGPGSPAETYDYDGSTWTSGNSFPAGNNSCQGIGAVNTAVVSTQAYDSTAMHHWNGTSWTAANARNTAKGGQAAFGTQTAAVLAGGYPSESNITEVYDGTNWTSGNTMNSGRNQIAGSGTQTDGMAYGGDAPPSEAAQTTIESWDGTSWATSPATLSTARSRSGAGRNTASGTWIAGGIGPGGGGEGFDSVEIYTKSVNITTAEAWSSASASNTTRYIASGVGSTTACVVYGGVLNPGTTLRAQTEEWDGSSWTESGDLSTARFGIGQGIGTQTAALAYGGYTSTIVNSVEEYDGSSWTAGGAMPATNRIQGGFGIQTAGVSVAGQGSPGKWTNVYHYDGSSWTSATAYPTAVEQMAGCGTQTAGLISGGSADPGVVSTQNEYDGSSWTAGGGLISALAFQNNNGTQTACQIIGGGTPSYTTAVSNYNGTSISTAPSLNTARGYGRGTTTSGAITGAIVTSGSVPGTPSSNTSEEFTAETTALNVKTLTQS